MWNNIENNGLHTKDRTRNNARQETTQTTLVDNLESLQSGNAVLFFYTNKLIYLSTLYLKSYVHPLFYITVYIIKKPYENIFTSQRIINHPQSVPQCHALAFTHTHTHTHARTRSFYVFSHAVHNTEGILRGLCNKEHTKQFKYGCGMKVCTHMHNNEHTHAHI